MIKQLSIIIPIHNSEKYLPSLIKKLKKINNDELEILFIDDKSNDSSVNLLKKIKLKNFKTFFLKKNKGVSYCRNLGIKKCKGKYILFHDSDDECFFEIKSLIEQIKNKEINFFYFFNKTNKKIDNNFIIKKKKFIDSIYNFKNFRLTCWNYIINRKFVVDNKIQFNNKIKVFEDQIFVLNLIKYSNNFQIIKKSHYIKNIKNPTSLSKITGKIVIRSSVFALREIIKLSNQKISLKFKKFLEPRIKYYIDQFFLNLNLVNKNEEKIYLKNLNSLMTSTKIENKFNIVNYIKIKKKNHIKFKILYLNKKKFFSSCKIVIYCSGLYGRVILKKLLNDKFKVKYLIDENKSINNKKMEGLNIYSPKKLKLIKNMNKYLIILANSNNSVINELIKKLTKLKLKKKQLILFK